MMSPSRHAPLTAAESARRSPPAQNDVLFSPGAHLCIDPNCGSEAGEVH